MSVTETATSLMTFVAGPSLVGVAAMTKFSGDVLAGTTRVARKGWLALGAEAAVLLWMAVFLVMAWPTLLRSWKADGAVEPTLVLLSATAAVAVGLIIFTWSQVRPTLRYLDESYRTDARGCAIDLVRRLTRPRSA